ncbi:MAG: phosphodiesterase [Comamonas sp.]|nr:phosphodiesterase [Candidatus Comamonas equi]
MPPLSQPASLSASAQQEDAPYQDLLGLWSDLEAALGLLLSHPPLMQQFPTKVVQLDTWLQELVAHDSDSALYVMFQLAGSSTIGYSASHALVCATFSHLLAEQFALPEMERNALVRAALTMNIGMTLLQDQLALQRDRPSVAQQDAIRNHPAEGQRLLLELGVTDKLWLDVVGLHHINANASLPLMEQAPAERLARILATCDRYAAMISPRRNRAGRSVADSVQAVTGPQSKLYEHAGEALIRSVGFFPPGVFVALSTRETAVVLRRTADSQHPLVAKLLDARKVPLHQPQLLQTNAQDLRITHALPAQEVNLQVDHRTMMRLGMYAARFSDGVQQLISVPGMR